MERAKHGSSESAEGSRVVAPVRKREGGVCSKSKSDAYLSSMESLISSAKPAQMQHSEMPD
eukprot:1334242-Pleurochrysis_carterae.AAC.1